nr:AI-2E family transporter [uncultured Flavobacterium sp.]
MKFEEEIKKRLLQQEAEELKTPITKEPVAFIVKLACTLVSLIAIVYVAIIAESILVPLIIAFLVAMLLVPFSDFMERKLKFSRLITSFISPIVFSLFVLGIVFFIGKQIVSFTSDIPEFEQKVITLFDQGTDYVSEKFGITKQAQLNYINKEAVSTLEKNSKILGGIIISFTTGIASAAFVFLYVFFFLLYRKHLVKFLVWSFRPEQKEQVRDTVYAVQSIIKQYIFGLLLQMTFIATALIIAFSIIGIKYAILFAVLCAVLNLIPYVGIFSATIFAAMVTLATGEPIDALWLFISVIIVNTIDNNVVTPKVIGSKVSLNAFVVFFGLIVAESIWGIAGMFLAIPTLAILKVVFDAVLELRPFGFLLGEDDQLTPIFDKYYKDDYERNYGSKSQEGKIDKVSTKTDSENNEEIN